MNAGWAAFLTVQSRESNRRSDGSPKIDLNQSLLTELYDQLEEEHGAEIATFITAYRLKGSTNIEKIEPPSSGTAAGSSSGTGSSPGSGSGSGSSSGTGSGSGSSSGSTGGGTLSNAQLQQGAQAVAGAVFGGGGTGDAGRYGPVRRGDVSVLLAVRSDRRAGHGQVNGEITTIIQSVDEQSRRSDREPPDVVRLVRLSDAEFTDGRININEAAYEVLQGLPDMPPELASQIADNNQSGTDTRRFQRI